MPTFKITGVDKVDRAFATLPKRVAKRVVSQAIRKALKPVKSKVEQLAPLGKTGQIKKKVKIRAKTGRKRGTIALSVQIGAGDFRGDQYYAAFVELGTKAHYTGKRDKRSRDTSGHGGGQKPQHFMRRAFEATAEEAKASAMREIAEGTLREVEQS